MDDSVFVDDTVSEGFMQATAGLSVEITRALTLHASWRWWIVPEHDVVLGSGAVIGVEPLLHSAELALRYSLGG